MFTVRLLGQFSLALDDAPVELPSRPAQSLLAWLVLHPDVAHRRERIAGMLWPDATDENAHNNLRHALWRLRRAVPEELVITDRIAIRWPANGNWQVDVSALTAAPTEKAGADALIPGLSAYGGELLPGFYDEWIALERERLASLHEERMRRLLELLLAEQRWQEAIDWAEKWIAHGRTPEAAYRALMLAHASQGHNAAALNAYQRCIDALDRDLSVPPSAETETLAELVRTGNAPDRMTGWQGDKVTNTSPPHLVTLSPRHPVISSNLPAPTTPLIGREAEVAHLSALLASPDHRLVTLLGPGGMGKSRLALAVDHGMAEKFPDGVFLVELTALTSPDEIPRAIGDALGYPYQTDPRPLRRQILDFLRNRRLLLILDNFEHLLEEPSLLVEILETGLELRLLVTSRERLRFHAETVYRLEGLDYPIDKQRVETDFPFAAAALFLESARRVDNGFGMEARDWPPLVRICRLVGGMPLGLILAASWTGILALPEIADELAASVAFLGQELQDLEPRHRTLEAVFTQSWHRLSPEEQSALVGLTVFAGGFDRAAARSVAGASLPLLVRLVDRSLLWRVAEERHDLHELVRQLARQKLRESGQEDSVRQRHSRYYLELVIRQTARLWSAEELDAVGVMNGERENIRTAWLWAAQQKQIELMLAAQEALGFFYNRPSHWQEGISLLGQAVRALDGEESPQALRLWLWLRAWQAIYLSQTGEVPLSHAHFTEILERVEDAPLDEREQLALTAFALLHRGGDLMTDRRRGETGVGLRRALEIYRELGDRRGVCATLQLLGNWETFNGQMRRGRERLIEALGLARQIGQPNQESEILYRISFVAEQMGDVEEAEQLARLGREKAKDTLALVNSCNRLGFVLLAAGKFDESVEVCLRGIGWVDEIRAHQRSAVFIRNTLARGYLDLGRFAEARQEAEKANDFWREVYGWEHPFLQRTLAMALLALGQTAEADALIRKSMESQTKMGNENLFALSGAYIDCAYPALAQHRQDDARRLLVTGLEMAQRAEAYNYEGLGFPAAALWLAREGNLSCAALVCGGMEKLTRLVHSRWYAAVALDELHRRLADLPPADRAAAEEQGRALGLQEITERLLALLA